MRGNARVNGGVIAILGVLAFALATETARSAPGPAVTTP